MHAEVKDCIFVYICDYLPFPVVCIFLSGDPRLGPSESPPDLLTSLLDRSVFERHIYVKEKMSSGFYFIVFDVHC